MKKFRLAVICLSVLAVLAVFSLPVAAQEGELIPVSGSFDYQSTRLAMSEIDSHLLIDAVEDEVWIGDFEGTATSWFPVVGTPEGTRDAWLYTEFEGTVLGEYEGTWQMIAIYYKPNPSAEWQGRWMILGGTGDLEHLRGYGVAWGPGSSDDGIPDIEYTGNVFFIEPIS